MCVRNGNNVSHVMRGAVSGVEPTAKAAHPPALAMVVHPEWSFVSVVLAADKDKEPRVYQAPGHVGSGKDTALCVFCDKSFAALVDRVSNHVAGCGAGGLTGIAACSGPRARDDEPPAAFATRQAQFAAARAKCASKNAELRAAAAALTKKRALDAATAPELYVPGSAKSRPQKQLRLDSLSAKNLQATIDLARGFYSAGIAPHVLSNKLLRRGLRSVAEAGADWRPPSADEVLGTLLSRWARVTPATTRRTAARAHARSRACPRQKVFCHELERPAKFQAQQLPRGACGGANR